MRAEFAPGDWLEATATFAIGEPNGPTPPPIYSLEFHHGDTRTEYSRMQGKVDALFSALVGHGSESEIQAAAGQLRQEILAGEHALAKKLDEFKNNLPGAIAKLKEGDVKLRLDDFVYLSFLTLATVGSSDILPNSTIARNLLAAESVLAVFFFAYAINVLVAPGLKQSSPATTDNAKSCE